jgi:hypothetical protein
MHPGHPPSQDDRAISSCISGGINRLCQFERMGIYAAKVLNASSVGSQNNSFIFNVSITKHASCRTLPELAL